MAADMSDAELVAFDADLHQRAEAVMRRNRAKMPPEKAADDEFCVAAIQHDMRKAVGIETVQCVPAQSLDEILHSPEREAYVKRRAEEIRQERRGDLANTR